MFKKATRRQAKLKLTIAGVSGSGKTGSALLLAKGIGGRIAVIDTENDSASLYVGTEIDGQTIPEFDSLPLRPPYTTKAYITAINEAVKEKYDILIIDSGSHQWAGEGGILSRKEGLDTKPGSNSFTNWAKFTPEHEQFKAAILNAPIHLIMTLRSKSDYVMQQNSSGKQAPVKVGLAPVQREGFEYEFSTMFEIDLTHNASVSKDRTGLFDGKYFKITEQTGRDLAAWLTKGDEYIGPQGVSLDSLSAEQEGGGRADPPKDSRPPPPKKPPADMNRPMKPEEIENLLTIAKKHLWSDDDFIMYMRKKYGTIVATKVTLGQGVEFHKTIVTLNGKQALASLEAPKAAPQPVNEPPAGGLPEVPPPEEPPHDFGSTESEPQGEFQQFQ